MHSKFMQNTTNIVGYYKTIYSPYYLQCFFLTYEKIYYFIHINAVRVRECILSRN